MLFFEMILLAFCPFFCPFLHGDIKIPRYCGVRGLEGIVLGETEPIYPRLKKAIFHITID